MPKRDDAWRSAIGVAAGGVPGAIGAVAVTGLLGGETFTKVAIGVAITAGCSLVGLALIWWVVKPPNPTMSAALRASGAVFDSDGNTVGYAFAATSELVVTAPVVVNRALGRDENDSAAPVSPGSIACLWAVAGDHPVDVQLAKWAPDDGVSKRTNAPAGYAVLRLASGHSLPKTVTPAVLALPRTEWEVDVKVSATDRARTVDGQVETRVSGGSYWTGRAESPTSGDLLGAPVVGRSRGHVVGILSGRDGEHFWFRHVTHDEIVDDHDPAAGAGGAAAGAGVTAVSETPRSRPPRLIGGVLVAVVVLALVSAFLVSCDSERAAGDCKGDRVSLSVVVSTEKDGLITDLADDFEDEYQDEDGACADIEVYGVNSGEAAEAIADEWAAPPDDRLECLVDGSEDCEVVEVRKPDLWLPTESVWPELLAAGELGEDGAGELAEHDGEWTSIASSVLTILMPAAKREKLSGSPDWDELLDKAAGGELSIAIDDPIRSTSGMATSVALNEALVADHDEEDAVGLLRDAIASVPDDLAGEDITRLMNRVYQNPDLLARMDAVVAQEQTAYLYNCQDPLGSDDFWCRDTLSDEDRRMVAVNPDDTIYAFDHPAVPMASLDSDAAKRAVSEAFVDYLRTKEAQKEFRAWGFRDAGDPENVTDELEDVVDADDVETLAPWPKPKTVNRWRHQWQNVRLPVRVLLSVDTSGSMEQIKGQDRRVRLDGFTDACTGEATDNPTYLQVAKSAALNAIGELKDGRDSVGLDWFPPAGKDTSTAIKPLSTTTRAQFKRDICELAAYGETPLYDAIRDASASVNASETEVSDRTVIVLLSDGGQNPPQSLDALMDEIGGEGAIPVIAVGIGDQAPIDVLGRLTGETGGALRNLSEPADVANLDRVLVDVFQGLAGKVS